MFQELQHDREQHKKLMTLLQNENDALRAQLSVVQNNAKFID